MKGEKKRTFHGNLAILCAAAHKRRAPSGCKLTYEGVEVTVHGQYCTYCLVDGERHIGLANDHGEHLCSYLAEVVQAGAVDVVMAGLQHRFTAMGHVQVGNYFVDPSTDEGQNCIENWENPPRNKTFLNAKGNPKQYIGTPMWGSITQVKPSSLTTVQLEVDEAEDEAAEEVEAEEDEAEEDEATEEETEEEARPRCPVHLMVIDDGCSQEAEEAEEAEEAAAYSDAATEAAEEVNAMEMEAETEKEAAPEQQGDATHREDEGARRKRNSGRGGTLLRQAG